MARKSVWVKRNHTELLEPESPSKKCGEERTESVMKALCIRGQLPGNCCGIGVEHVKRVEKKVLRERRKPFESKINKSQ